MSMFQIKICGVTRPQDAELAAKLGADMIGMVFFPGSPRAITRSLAKRIVAAIPPTLDRVGVFVDENIEMVMETAKLLALTHVQLHGQESRREILSAQKGGMKVIKAFGISERKDWFLAGASRADLVLVDTRRGDRTGGTGMSFDWEIRPTRRISNLVLAGGISGANLAEGVKIFRPLVVDVNSSIESTPGIKSPSKMKRFFEVCNSVRYGN